MFIGVYHRARAGDIDDETPGWGTMTRICLISDVTRFRAGSIVGLAGAACYRPSPSSSNAQTLLITPQLVTLKTHELNPHHSKHCCGLISRYRTCSMLASRGE
jgi:hypothetical protein